MKDRMELKLPRLGTCPATPRLLIESDRYKTLTEKV
jgi:hypothetical protein